MSRAARATRRQVFNSKRAFAFSSSDYPDLPPIPLLPSTEMLPMIPIANSSNLEASRYCHATQVLAIRFKGGKVYHHKDVPADLAEAFDAAESKGKFYAQAIKPAHPGELVVEAHGGELS